MAETGDDLPSALRELEDVVAGLAERELHRGPAGARGFRLHPGRPRLPGPETLPVDTVKVCEWRAFTIYAYDTSRGPTAPVKDHDCIFAILHATAGTDPQISTSPDGSRPGHVKRLRTNEKGEATIYVHSDHPGAADLCVVPEIKWKLVFEQR
jgi:hypothetical protein